LLNSWAINAINKQATNGQKDDQRPSKYVQFLCMMHVNSPGGSISAR